MSDNEASENNDEISHNETPVPKDEKEDEEGMIIETRWQEHFAGENDKKPMAREYHNMATLEKDTIILFGGGVGILGRPTKEYFSDTWLYHGQTHSWEKIEPLNSPPQRRLTGLAATEEGIGLLFGGETIVDGNSKILNDTWIFNKSSNNWQEISSSNSPPPSNGHSLTFVGNGKFVLFGSDGRETWIFDLPKKQWSKLETIGSSPNPRKMHAAARIGSNSVLLFSGQQLDGKLENDTWILNLDSSSWQKIDSVEPAPSARKYHSLASISHNKVVLMGGFIKFPNFDDLWSFDLRERTWTKLVAEIRPLPSHGHELAKLRQGTVLKFGGYNQKETNLNDSWELNIRFDN